jgi:hypothetical protein
VRDRIDLTSLISGVVFLLLGLLFLLDEVGAVDFEIRWVWPALLIGLGVAWLASTWRVEELDEAGERAEEPVDG